MGENDQVRRRRLGTRRRLRPVAEGAQVTDLGAWKRRRLIEEARKYNEGKGSQ
jgi:hypothetical protein